MKRLRLLLLATALAISFCVQADWSVDWYSIDGGGSLQTTGGDWSLSATIGQTDATSSAALAGGGWQLTGGFWAVLATSIVLDQIFQDRFEPAEAPVLSFSKQLVPTFLHPRCVTCHAVAAEDFRRVTDTPPGVLPATHPEVTASTNCVGCHVSSLLPAEGNIDPGWQAAPAAFDFRGQSIASLCVMASQPVSGHSPLEHMTEDKLVLWSVGDGRVPFGFPSLQTAPPNDIGQWRTLVQQWVDAGMPCD